MDGRIGRTDVAANSLLRNILQISDLPSIFCGRQRRSEQDNYSRISNLSSSRKKIVKGIQPLDYRATKLLCFRQSGTRLFEPAGGDRSEDEASDVREVRHAAGLDLRHCAGMHQLSEKPKSNQKRRRDEGDLH